MFEYDSLFFALALALILDALLGDPRWLYRIFPHPIVLQGRLIAMLERSLLRRGATAVSHIRKGGVLILVVVLVSVAIGIVIQSLCLQGSYGWIWLGMVMSMFLSQRSLADHVGAVGSGLDQGVEQGRGAVAHIVGRDPEHLDEHGVARAAVESLAENFSDGVVAPVFWGLLLGLPGLMAYKAINTADSMIGHRSERYLYFGRIAAKLDDAANWLPARLSGLIILAAAAFMPAARFDRSLQAIGRDARNHRSPNAGWPEAAMAGALDFRLAGPRYYDGEMTQDSWMGDGRPDLTSSSIKMALRLFWLSCDLLFLVVLVMSLMMI